MRIKWNSCPDKSMDNKTIDLKRRRFILSTLFVSAATAAGVGGLVLKKWPFPCWKYIVIHHSATGSGNADAFHRYHLKKGYGGLAYHFVIGNGNGSPDGKIEEGFRWKKQLPGAHVTLNAAMYNWAGIGICLVGNFENQHPTDKQMESLAGLVAGLSGKYGIAEKNITEHRKVPWNFSEKTEQTVCPGKNFSLEDLKRMVLAGEVSS